jgi:hypothetical protein
MIVNEANTWSGGVIRLPVDRVRQEPDVFLAVRHRVRDGNPVVARPLGGLDDLDLGAPHEVMPLELVGEMRPDHVGGGRPSLGAPVEGGEADRLTRQPRGPRAAVERQVAPMDNHLAGIPLCGRPARAVPRHVRRRDQVLPFARVHRRGPGNALNAIEDRA